MATVKGKAQAAQGKTAPASVPRHILTDSGELNVHPVYRMEIPLHARMMLRVDVSFAGLRACVASREECELHAFLNVVDKLAKPGLFFAVPLIVAMKLGNAKLNAAASQCLGMPWAIATKSSNGKIEFHAASSADHSGVVDGVQEYRLWVYNGDFLGTDKCDADMDVMRSALSVPFDMKKVNTTGLWSDTANAGPVMDHMPHCDSCDVYWDKLSVCGGCRARRYCSVACQKADWKGGHKGYCKK